MRVLITGGAGFIGSHLTDRFLEDGHEMIAVDNLSTGRLSNLERASRSPCFQFIEHDFVLPLDLREEVDWVLHFASPASPPKYLRAPVETLRVNAEGTCRLLELARQHGAAFLLASTSEIYGNPLVHPQPEAYWGNVNSLGPRSVYDGAKGYAESLTSAFSTAFALPSTCRADQRNEVLFGVDASSSPPSGRRSGAEPQTGMEVDERRLPARA